MPIFRRKRGTKYVGSWITRVAGREVNLATKDAREARTREKLARSGAWPPDPEADARKAAAEVASAMEGKSPARPGKRPAVAAPPPVPRRTDTVPPEPAPPPSPRPAAPVDAADPDDFAAAVDDAADVDRMADALGVTPDELKAKMLDNIREAPDQIAGALLWLQGKGLELAYRFTADGKTGARLTVARLGPETKSRKVTALGVELVLRDLNIDLSRVPSWAILLAGLTISAGMQLEGATVAPKVAEPPQPEPLKAV